MQLIQLMQLMQLMQIPIRMPRVLYLTSALEAAMLWKQQYVSDLWAGRSELYPASALEVAGRIRPLGWKFSVLSHLCSGSSSALEAAGRICS
jgi:hypothetical protein